MRIIKWSSESCEKLVKRYKGEHFDNAFHDYRRKHTDNRKCLSTTLHIKNIPMMYI